MKKRNVNSLYHGNESLLFLRPQNMGFHTSGNETVRDLSLLQIKNIEFSTL